MTSNSPAEFFIDLIRNNLQQSNTNLTPTISGLMNNKKIPIDMINEEKTIYIYAELPGIPKENIEVDILINKITIIADKTLPYDSPDVSEIKTGKFERTINLPICISKKEVTIEYNNGILKIKINKLNEDQYKFKLRID